jgi:glycosyltransferase involved in cell wall biosynthesis
MSTLLSINNYYYYRGGAETVFLEQNKLLERQGWKVVPFAMHHPKNMSTPWSAFFVDEIEFGQDYSFAQKLLRAPKVIYSIEARRKLNRLLNQVKPDVAHAHNIYHHISPSILSLLKGRGVPTVLTLHDLKIACPAYHMLAPDGICERCKGGHLYNVVANRCIKGSAALSTVIMAEAVLHRALGSYTRCVDRFVVPSQFYIDKLCEWGMPRSLFRHIPNFVDTSLLQPRFEPGSAFLYFGRVSREKGIGTLIRAAASAKCALRVVGTGPELDEMRELAQHLKADVTFLGYQTGAALYDAVASSLAVVLPSQWYENAPMSVLEAYALGKPVLGARIGGIPELVKDGETGTSFESGNVDSLASALRHFAGLTSQQVSDMGRRGRAWVETSFTIELYRERILNLYRELGVDDPSQSASVLS